jgi:phenylalanyl-tRNA synthetase beta chain
MPVERDFAFVLDRDVPAANVLRAVRGADKTLIQAATVFDVFEHPSLGEGRKSMAVAVTLQPRERTMTDPEIDAVATRIVAAVEKATGGRLRA